MTSFSMSLHPFMLHSFLRIIILCSILSLSNTTRSPLWSPPCIHPPCVSYSVHFLSDLSWDGGRCQYLTSRDESDPVPLSSLAPSDLSLPALALPHVTPTLSTSHSLSLRCALLRCLFILSLYITLRHISPISSAATTSSSPTPDPLAAGGPESGAGN